ncbi:MAG TPA: hypothetical protein VFR81_08560 [Longimicrobium sp.]|nr:hypothetical protein [Longimicrobium sp.]
MRKVLILAAALAMFAGPALAQQQSRDAAAATEPAAAVTAVQASSAQPAEAARPAPSIHVSNETIRQQVQLAEAQRADKAQIGGQSWWYLVAAIAVGVLIAVLIAD